MNDEAGRSESVSITSDVGVRREWENILHKHDRTQIFVGEWGQNRGRHFK